MILDIENMNAEELNVLLDQLMIVITARSIARRIGIAGADNPEVQGIMDRVMARLEKLNRQAHEEN